MRCLSKLGTNIVIQDEANDGQWAGLGGAGAWQPLEWMGSSWRDVTDRGVDIDYNVTPFMVGNLADLVFDGQSSITQRKSAMGQGCNYVGNRHFMAAPPENDPADFGPMPAASGNSWGSLDGWSPARTTATSSAPPRPTWRRAPGAPSRTTTSRPRSSPTCRFRWTRTAQPAPAALGST